MIERAGAELKVEATKSRWKLWHMTAAVLVSALGFAAIRALGDGSNKPWVLLILASILGSVFVGSISLGAKLGEWFTRGLRDWALDRGDVIGFCAWVLALGMILVFILAAVVIVPAAFIACFYWIIRVAGL